MKVKILPILLLISIVPTLAAAQQKSESAIAAIRAEVGSINLNSKNYARTTKDIEGISLEGATAIYFVADREIKKIRAKIYGETFNSSAEIFYRDRQPIFIFLKINRYETPIGTGGTPKVVAVEEQRIYYANGKTIKVMLGKTAVPPSEARFVEIERALTELSEKFLAAYAE